MLNDHSKEPLSNIKWMPADDLSANNYNPNVVHSPELRLLEKSILDNGWIQPIIASKDGIVIDRFHRWMLSRTSKELIARYRKVVPVVVLDISRAEAMMLTIRINRAKGTHTAIKMNEVVKELILVHNCDKREIAIDRGYDGRN